MATFKEQIRSCTKLNLSPVGSTSADAVDAISFVPVANANAAALLTVTNASMGQATTLTIPDPGAATASYVLAPSSSSVVLTSTVTMSAAQVNGAYAAPVQLVPAPGSGLCIFVTAAYVSTHYDGSTAFASGTGPIIQYGNTVHGAGTIATASGLVTGDIEATTDQTRNLLPIATGAQTGLSNKGIYFSSTAAYTAGGTGTVSITVNYVIVSSDN